MKGNCGECERRYFCEIAPDKCDEWPDPVPQTNADRIRAMSNEELADYWLKCTCVCDWCELKAKCDEDTISKDRCVQGVLEWLKQPADGDSNTPIVDKQN